jgi:chromosome segregation ATPase
MSKQRLLLWSLVIFGGLISGCFQTILQRPQSEPPPCPPDRSVELSTLQTENQELQQKLSTNQETQAASQAKIQQLEKQITDLNMRQLEYEAVVNDLRNRSEILQRRLEEAIVEVVRTKAKLRSIESKAEAVSTLAEAEIALKELKSQLPSPDKANSEEIATAELLLNMSDEEFNAQNFGGALYLANQSKNQVRSIQTRLSRNADNEAMAVGAGESAFSQPLPLKVLQKSNLRQGPGLDEKIIGLLLPDTLVTGHAYKDGWIRVSCPDGASGWIFQPLVGTR